MLDSSLISHDRSLFDRPSLVVAAEKPLIHAGETPLSPVAVTTYAVATTTVIVVDYAVL